MDQSLPADSSFYLMTAINELNGTTPQLQKREVYGPTSSEGSLCRAVTVLFARGTIEPGNVGLIAGKPEEASIILYNSLKRSQAHRFSTPCPR